MSKPKITAFLKDFVIVNAVLVGGYLVLTMLMSMFFGEAMVEFTQAPATGEEQNLFLKIFFTLLQVALFVGFYFLSLIRMSKDAEERREFLTELGAEKLSASEFSKKYFDRKGKYSLIYYSALMGVVSLLNLIGVPFISLIITPQSILPSAILSFLGVYGSLRNILLFLLTLAVNIPIYYLYQRVVCTKVYEKWADERLRVN